MPSDMEAALPFSGLDGSTYIFQTAPTPRAPQIGANNKNCNFDHYKITNWNFSLSRRGGSLWVSCCG